MYKVKPVLKDEDIIKFENMRYKAFDYDKTINSADQSSYARAIKEMEKYAFFCVDENDTAIGGILLSSKNQKPQKSWEFLIKICYRTQRNV